MDDGVSVFSRGDRRITWVRISGGSPQITRTLEDARLDDPVAAEPGNYRGAALVIIADFRGRKLINYLIDPISAWGDKVYALRVEEGGAAGLERPCGNGDLGTPSTVDGHMQVDFAWVVSGGVPTDTAADGTPTTLDADVAENLIVGTLADADGRLDVRLSRNVDPAPTFIECP